MAPAQEVVEEKEDIHKFDRSKTEKLYKDDKIRDETEHSFGFSP
jgi:hypothetical protein